MREWDVPGLSIAIVKDDRIVFIKGFGLRESGKAGAVDEPTLFAIGSATKGLHRDSLVSATVNRSFTSNQI